MIIFDYALRLAIERKEAHYRFTINQRKSRGSVLLSRLTSALSMTLRLCQTPLRTHRFCCLAWKVNERRWVYGLTLRKRRVMSFNVKGEVRITTKDGLSLVVKKDFKYLGSYTSSTEKDIGARKAQAWSTLHNLKNIGRPPGRKTSNGLW